ncbi:MAG: hypothetical protein OEY79_02230 [Anaplasmataceae bacterium]|nr:hypothetical protein [Anaplasmataceae bacterium]
MNGNATSTVTATKDNNESTALSSTEGGATSTAESDHINVEKTSSVSNEEESKSREEQPLTNTGEESRGQTLSLPQPMTHQPTIYTATKQPQSDTSSTAPSASQAPINETPSAKNKRYAKRGIGIAVISLSLLALAIGLYFLIEKVINKLPNNHHKIGVSVGIAIAAILLAGLLLYAIRKVIEVTKEPANERNNHNTNFTPSTNPKEMNDTEVTHVADESVGSHTQNL